MNDRYSKVLGLYIHIPFCDHICVYCDFKKIVASYDLKSKYIDALIKEIEYKAKENCFKDIQTIYIGGGTPSSLSFDLLEKLLNTLDKSLDLNSIIEFTIETNPKDINDNNINNWISLFNKYHINRISLGVQSFDDNKLKYLNRNHTKEEAINCLKLLKANNFNNINCDLIYGFPMDNELLIINDINTAIKCDVTHISYYSLILEENTILYHNYENNMFEEMAADKEADIYNFINEYLKSKNYYRYEISNFSKIGYESKHNLLTWDNLHYEACGVAGSMYIASHRSLNTKSIENYINHISTGDYRGIIEEDFELTNKDIMDEAIMLGLRKENGIDIIEFLDRYNKDIFEEYPNIKILIENDILETNNNYLRIKCDKIYLENAILCKIL